MAKILTNSPKTIVSVVQSILGEIEDHDIEFHLIGFENFEDLGVDEDIRSFKITLKGKEYILKLQHIIRENGDSLYISSEGRNLIQYVFKYYTLVENNKVTLFHDGRINGIPNLRNVDTINALLKSDLAALVDNKKIVLGEFDLPFKNANVNVFLSNLIKYAIFRREFGDSYNTYNVSDVINKKYWLYQPGEDARFWEEFYNQSIIGLGWDYLGDLGQYGSKDEIANQLRALEKTTSSKKNDATANWDFYKSMQIGDVVIVKKGISKILGYGEVTSDYFYDVNRSEYTSVRKVNWKKKGEWNVGQNLALKTLTDITIDKSKVNKELSLYNYLLEIMDEERDYKELFKKWLKDSSSSTSNKTGSYIRAIEILNEILHHNIFKINDIKYLDDLYQDLIKNQNDPNGTYAYDKAKSYGKGGFYSPAINEYKKFHLELNEIVNPSNYNNMPLNQILYGPPGTGKTYKLKNEYFSHFIVKEISQTREQFLNDYVSNLTWWQIITIVLLDIKRAKVLDIHNHELIKIKENLSTSKTVRPTIWGQLQSHTVLNCEYVKVADRSEPLYFHKDSDSYWTIIEDDLKEKFPEAYILYEKYKNHVASPDVEIHNYDFVTFHQSFSYEDFVEGIKPILDENSEGDVKFKVEDGVFKRLCDKARRDPNHDYALFIDEINRGNVSAIFGELITLIEETKREGSEEALQVTLPYSKQKFSVPANLYIIGTMNTADRSVEALDTALRRRFVFEEMLPQPELLEQQLYGFSASAILERINQRIEKLIDRDHCIGHAYFIGKNESTIIDSFYKNIIPLLQEYFFGDYGKIGLVLGKGFVRLKKEEGNVFADFDYDYVDDLASKPIYEIIDYRTNQEVDLSFEKAIHDLMR